MHGSFVGTGMLDAAVAGEVFTSPTPDQVLAATKGADSGAGVLLIVKNYTGDVLNFEMAAELAAAEDIRRSEEHTSELQSLMRISYAVFCLQKKKTHARTHISTKTH